MGSFSLFTMSNKETVNNFYKDEIVPDLVSSDQGIIRFSDNKYFATCYSPLKMIELGIFGRGYFGIKDVEDAEFKKILDLVPDFSNQIDGEIKSKILLYPQNFKLNRYGIRAGLDHSSWTENGWIHSDDPYGWFNWYVRFYYGRRHKDDFRQINRFRAFIRRHWGMLNGFCQKTNISIDQAEHKYQKTCQGLLQWAWDHKINPDGRI